MFPELNEMRSEFNAEKQKISEDRREMNGLLLVMFSPTPKCAGKFERKCFGLGS